MSNSETNKKSPKPDSANALSIRTVKQGAHRAALCGCRDGSARPRSRQSGFAGRADIDDDWKHVEGVAIDLGIDLGDRYRVCEFGIRRASRPLDERWRDEDA